MYKHYAPVDEKFTHEYFEYYCCGNCKNKNSKFCNECDGTISFTVNDDGSCIYGNLTLKYTF